MISLGVKFIEQEVLVNLDRLPEKVQAILELKLGELIAALRAKVVENLSGKVLNIKSGALVGSVASGVERHGNTMIGYVDIEPPNETVKQYALLHEYGGKGYYWIQVGPKGFLANREDGFFSRRDVYHPPAKERSYLRSAFAEDREAITVGLEEALREAAL